MFQKVAGGVSVIVNTSVDVRGEPIVCTQDDAFRCFMSPDIEVLAAGKRFLRRLHALLFAWPW